MHFQQAGVTGRVQGFGPHGSLSSGRSPAPVARGFDDDGVDWGLFPVQIPMKLQLSF